MKNQFILKQLIFKRTTRKKEVMQEHVLLSESSNWLTTQMVSEQRVIQSVAADYYCLNKDLIVRGSLFIYYETVETF